MTCEVQKLLRIWIYLKFFLFYKVDLRSIMLHYTDMYMVAFKEGAS